MFSYLKVNFWAKRMQSLLMERISYIGKACIINFKFMEITKTKRLKCIGFPVTYYTGDAYQINNF